MRILIIEDDHVIANLYDYLESRGHRVDAAMGLGLAIVKRICDQSGWRITLHSAENQGIQAMIDFSSMDFHDNMTQN